MPDHPIPDAVVSSVADEHDIPADRLTDRLDDVQHHLERGAGQYEYSTHHNFGWEDADTYYLYGSDRLWELLGDELSLSDDEVAALRSVHLEELLRSAEKRDEEETVREMLDDGNDALVVTSASDGDPGFGLEV